ncbi:MAG: response regulator [Turneriella sp.]|nr:response regulator [Turneriella sp.]
MSATTQPFLGLEVGGNRSAWRILLVEDVESIQLAIRDFLFSNYEVQLAASAEEALMHLAVAPDFDLLLTDIRLPKMNGLELARLARKLRPQLPVVFITSYDVNEFIETFAEHGFSYVITKHGRMSLREIQVTIEKILTRDIFGARKYFPQLNEVRITANSFPKPFTNGVLYTVTVTGLYERSEICDRIAAQLRSQRKAPEATIKLVLDEMTSNAIFRAPVNAKGEFKYQLKNGQMGPSYGQPDIRLEPEDYFTLQFGFYDDWIILGCADPHGRLTKKEVLYRLQRHLMPDPATGLPAGLRDPHGRGLFLLREQLSSLVINIAPGKRTEVLGFLNTTAAQAYKNITIYELEAN